MTETDIQKYMDQNGIRYVRALYDGKEKLRVMDTTVLPQALREQFDERGFLKPEEANKKGATK